MPRTTIKDVAQKSGYSIATVSLVLNNKEVSIPQSTRDKIIAIAKEMDYRPNQLAVGMVTKRTWILGLIIPDNSNMFFADLSKAVEEAAWNHGFSLIYGNSSNDPKRDLNYLKMFVDRQVDGIIYAKSSSYSEDEGKKSIEFISHANIPVITIDRQINNGDFPAVMLNHFKGGYLATKHLIELGHRCIGCFTGPSDLVSSDERLDGYRSALQESGIPIDENLFFEGDYQPGREKEALRHFVSNGATAVFAFNDIMALGLYREARQHGMKIPDDLSIVGFDDIPFADIIDPALTTVRQPVAQMGQCAIDILLELVEDKNTSSIRRKYTFEPTLITRKSTSPPNRS